MRPVTTGVDHQLRTMYTKWFCACNDDLMRMIMLIEACVCCFAGADLPVVGSELQGFGAKGADRSKTPFVRKRSGARREWVMWDAAEVLHGHNGVVGRFGAKGAARAVALALSEEHRYT
jgi:hypothetical protein